MNPIGWIKNNKLAFVLILAVLYFALIRNPINRPFMMRNAAVESFSYGTAPMMGGIAMDMGMTKAMPSSIGRPEMDVYGESTNTTATDRRVITETYLSLQVEDVPTTILQIKSKAESLKGFMINSNVSRPEEAANGSITIRVPSNQSDEMISFLKENSIKVVNEDIQGRDITDQYSDVEGRLATLQKNKARFEVIMDSAETVDEILRVQSQLFQLQDQIDSLIGQRDYLRNTSDSVKITAYLSTDEFALPYVPDTSWRPEVVFKEAVRALVMDLRGLVNSIIWLAVYALVWIPLLLIAIAGVKYWKRRYANTVVVTKKNSVKS